MSWTKKYSDKVSAITGIQLGVSQVSMVEARIKKRFIELKINSHEEYSDYFDQNEESETQNLVSLLTTHHTFFFREFRHFDFLEEKALKVCAEAAIKRGDKKIQVWSAACSKGQEVYSLAMFLNFHLPLIAPGVDFEVFGTDVDPESVKIAENGVYPYSEIKEIPMNYLAKNWARGTGSISEFAKIKKQIKSRCHFDVVNLQNFNQKISDQQFDLIFCRNVFIYFTPEQIKEITNNLLKKMNPDGFLFVGLSESISSLGLKIDVQGPSVYTKKRDAKEIKDTFKKVTPVEPVAPLPAPIAFEMPSLLRVLCVDDSPSIHTLLSRILNKENGFEIIGSAKNGKEAELFIKNNKIDIMTLDIHMPEQNGIEYLTKNNKNGHAPVVMISSVSREDSGLAFKALELGALDYIEKPSLTQLNEKSDEIRTKIKCAYKAFHQKRVHKAENTIDRKFKKTPLLTHVSEKLRVIYLNPSDHFKLEILQTEWSLNEEPAVLLLIDGQAGSVEHYAHEWSKKGKKKFDFIEFKKDQKVKLVPGSWSVSYLNSGFDYLAEAAKNLAVSFMILGDAPQKVLEKLKTLKTIDLLVEDSGDINVARAKWFGVARDVVPVTSFGYMSNEFLIKEDTKKAA